MQFPYLLFVYGSLKRGENDYPYWLADPEESVFIGDATTTKPYPLYVTLMPNYNICEPCLEDITSSKFNVSDVDRQSNVLHKNVVSYEETCENSKLQKNQFVVTCQKCVKWSKMPQCVHGELFAITAKMKAWLDIYYDTYVPEKEHVADAQTNNDTDDTNNSINENICPLHNGGNDNNQILQLKWTCGTINVRLPISRKMVKRLECVTSFALDKEIKAITYFAERKCKHKANGFACTCHDTSEGSICDEISDYTNCFSAASCLERYGARFNHGKPRHLLYDDEMRRRVSHLFMSLERELQPKLCTTWRFKNTNNANKRQIKEDNWEQISEEMCTGNPNERSREEIPSRVVCTRSADECKSMLLTPITPAPIVLFIIDGVGDNTYVELGNRTPLEVVANVPPRWREVESRTSELPFHSTLLETQGTLDVREILNSITCVNRNLCNESTRTTLNDRRKYAPLCECLERFVEEGINTITRHGLSGLMDPYMAGMSCGSDTAHLSMFGYPPLQYYRGRGAYEALGAGLILDDGDVAFKSNFATLQDTSLLDVNSVDNKSAPELTRCVLLRRCDRDFTREGPVLCHDLNNTVIEVDEDGVPFAFPHRIKIQYATEHRCGVALSGPCTKNVNSEAIMGSNIDNNSKVNAGTMYLAHPGGHVMGVLSDKITGTDPLKDNRELIWCTPTVDEHHPEYIAAMYTSRLVNAASAKLSRLLNNHPINVERREYNKKIANMMHCKMIQEKCAEHNVSKSDENDDISHEKITHANSNESQNSYCVNSNVANERQESMNIKKEPRTICESYATETTKEKTDVNENKEEESNGIDDNNQTSDSSSANSCVSSHTSQFLPLQTQQTEKLPNLSLECKGDVLREKKNVANVILFRGAAKKGWVPSFATRHGLIGAIIAPTCIIKGLGLCCGLSGKIYCKKQPMEKKHKTQQIKTTTITTTKRNEIESRNQIPSDNTLHTLEKKQQQQQEMLQYQEDEFEEYAMEGATGDVHSDLMVKVKAALCAIYGHSTNEFSINYEKCQDNERNVSNESFPLQDSTLAEQPEFTSDNQIAYNFVVIHVKGVDDAGHDKSLYDKLNMLNKCGKAMKTLWDALPDNATMGVVADHSTPLWIGDHCCEPVPISIATKRRKTLTKLTNKYTLRDSTTDSGTNSNAIQINKDDPPTCKHESEFRNCQKVFALKDDHVLHDSVQHYSEIEARRGALGRFRGEQLIDLMKRLHYHFHYH